MFSMLLLDIAGRQTDTLYISTDRLRDSSHLSI